MHSAAVQSNGADSKRPGLWRGATPAGFPPGSPDVFACFWPGAHGRRSRRHGRDPATAPPPRRSGTGCARCCGGRPSPILRQHWTVVGRIRAGLMGKAVIPGSRLRHWHGDGWQFPPPSARRGPWRSARSWDGSRVDASVAQTLKRFLRKDGLAGGKATKVHTAQHWPFQRAVQMGGGAGGDSVAGIGHADALTNNAVGGSATAMDTQHGLWAGLVQSAWIGGQGGGHGGVWNRRRASNARNGG